MPVKSAKQFRMFEAAAHGSLKGAGPSQDVADEFLNDTPESTKSSFAKQNKFALGMKKKKKKTLGFNEVGQ